MTSGRAACTCEWMANAAWFTGASPSTTSPVWLTRMRSDTRICLKDRPNGLTQKWSSSSGSRAVMWPATPSSKPNLPNSRNAPARRCLRKRRSSSTVRSPVAVGNFTSVAAMPPSLGTRSAGLLLHRVGGRGRALGVEVAPGRDLHVVVELVHPGLSRRDVQLDDLLPGEALQVHRQAPQRVAVRGDQRDLP